jgi:hypothetical protein
MAKIRARYIGGYAVTLKDATGVLDGDGKPLTTGLLVYGDTLMMSEEDILGQTFFAHPRTGVLESQGAGRTVKPEHTDLNWTDNYDDLLRLGYSYHEGRSDFEVVVEEPAPVEEPVPIEDVPVKSRAKKGE